jgi:serine/threonine protein kinase
MLKPSKAALKEFICEMQIVSCLRHTNIISLAGFCFENKSLILVYNYLPNGSLEEILHGMLFLPLLLFLALKMCVPVLGLFEIEFSFWSIDILFHTLRRFCVYLYLLEPSTGSCCTCIY